MTERLADRDLRLEYRPFTLDLADPLETGDGTIASREGFLVRLSDADDPDNPVGFGEATPLPGWTESAPDCEAALARAAEAIADGPAAALRSVDEHVAARHGVALAVADMVASREATPLYRYVGNGPMVGRVPVNATIGDAPVAETANEVAAAVDRGFDCCKLKLGRRHLEDDLERVRRAREVAGGGVELRVDANGAWSFDEATRALETLAAVDVAVLEQPLPAGALEGHADLRGRTTDVQIALDEGLLEHGVDTICDAGAADAVVLKPMALGGIDVARKVAAWVQELEIEPIVTTTIDAVVARTAAVHLAASIPDVPASGLATAELLAEDLGRDPVLLDRGSAVVPQTKGIGVEGVWEA